MSRDHADPAAKRQKLSSSIIPIKNPDKQFHESWESRKFDGETFDRHPMNFPHPARVVLFGPPGTGKTTVALNLVVRQDPPFERIMIIHVDGEFTKEYNKLQTFTKLKSIPDPEWWTDELKTLVILDDLEFRRMGKRQKANLDRLMGFVSTHKNITVYVTAQDGFNIACAVRRCADVWILWRGRDMDSMHQIARKAGLKKGDLDAIFHCYDFGLQDSVWLDTTPHSPFPIRFNGTMIISEDKLKYCRDTYKSHVEEQKQNFKNKKRNRRETVEALPEDEQSAEESETTGPKRRRNQ